MQYNYVRGIKFRLLFAAAIGGATITAACSSPSSLSPAVPEIRFNGTAPDANPSPTPTPYAFVYQTIDNPRSSVFTRAYAIDDLAMIVGTVKINGGNDTAGYTSAREYTFFHGLAYPGATSTVVTSVDPAGRTLAGYFVKGGTITGFIRERGLWTEYRDGDAPKGEGSVNKLLGVNDNGIAVGYYQDTDGKNHGFELANRRFVNIAPPNGVSVVATAVTLAGNVAGDETLKTGEVVGWLLRSGNYSIVNYPGSTKTQINGMSDGISDNLLVGSYVNSSGTHGFIVRGAGGTPEWQTIDEPDAKGFTVVTGMNNHHVICGWYVDASHHTHGFVATLKQ
jgi:hypothetical protein